MPLAEHRTRTRILEIHASVRGVSSSKLQKLSDGTTVTQLRNRGPWLRLETHSSEMWIPCRSVRNGSYSALRDASDQIDDRYPFESNR